jgi:hypothetical protein
MDLDLAGAVLCTARLSLPVASSWTTMLSRFGASALRANPSIAQRGLHATAAPAMYFKRMELEVWFDKWQ